MPRKVLVYAEVRSGKLKSTALECLTAASALAGGDPQNLHAILLGEGAAGHAEELKKYGAGKVYIVETPETAVYQCEPHLQAISALIAKESYTVVIGPASPTGRDFFPRLAIRQNAGLLTEVTDVSLSGSEVRAKRPIYAGKCLAELAVQSPLALITIRPNVIAPKQNPVSGVTESFAPQFDSKAIGLKKIIEVKKGKSEKPDLTEANIIISGGRAMANAENFRILNTCADVIGATVGASRAAVDAGYAPHDMQVGQTGKTVNPSLYIACGISGSIQHLAGMRTSKVIVAINTDPDAPIFQKADYGIVADLFDAVPVLEKEFGTLLNS
jgi:electron transfer flavoprotein alpha subunit